MPKKKEEEAEIEITEENPEEETPSPDTLPETYSKEAIDALIKDALAEQYSKLNKPMTTLGQENKRLREQLSQPTTGRGKLDRIYLEDLKARQTEFGESNPRLTSLISEAEREIIQQEQAEVYKTKVQAQQRTINTEREELEKRITDAGLSSSDEKLIDVWESFSVAETQTGDFTFANKRLDRIIKSVMPKEEKKEAKEPDVEEGVRKEMEKRGLLNTDTGGPSASAMSAQKAMQEYGAGNITAEEAKKRGAKFM